MKLIVKACLLLFVIFALMSTASAGNVLIKKVDNNKYQIFQKPADSKHWIRYDLTRFRTPAKGVNGKQDVYRIDKVYQVDIAKTNSKAITFKNPKRLTGIGNWEKAVEIQTKKGKVLLGGCHGYELNTMKKVYINCLPKEPQLGYIYPCKNLTIQIGSKLINPDNHKQTLALVTTNYIWNGESLTTSTYYNWKASATVTRAYAAMFPVSNNPSVSSKGQVYGQPAEGMNSFKKPVRGDSLGGMLWNNQNTLKFSMNVLSPNYLFNYNYSGNSKTFIRSLPGYYNKIYVTMISSPNKLKVIPGNIWKVAARYRIWG